MSYDIDIGSQCFNYTSNVSKLFYDHIPADRSRGGLHELHCLTGKQALPVLASAFEAMNRTYLNVWRDGDVGATAFTSKYDAPNGWGSTVGALFFLAQVMAACAANPRCKVKVCA